MRDTRVDFAGAGGAVMPIRKALRSADRGPQYLDSARVSSSRRLISRATCQLVACQDFMDFGFHGKITKCFGQPI